MTAVTSPGLLSGLVQSGIHGLFAKGSDNSTMLKKLPLIFWEGNT